MKSGTTASLCDYAVALPNTGRRGRFGRCGPSGRLLFDVLSLVHEFLIDGVYDQVAQNAEEDAENQRNQNVGRVVDVQVQPGEGNQDCQNRGRDAQTLVVEHQHRAGLKGSDGVAGGEGVIVQTLDQKGYLPSVFLQLEIVGPDAGYLGLQDDVAYQKAQNQGHAHGKAGFSVFREEQQGNGHQNPEHAAVSEQRDNGHGLVQKCTLQMCLNPVQDGQVKGHCQGIEKRLQCCEHGHSPFYSLLSG